MANCFSRVHECDIHTYIHTVSQKNETPNFRPYLRQMFFDQCSKFFYWYTQQEICIKEIITDPAVPKRCHRTTLQNISFQELYQLKAQ